MLLLKHRQKSTVVCRFIANIHQVQFQVFLFIVQKHGPAYIQDFKDLLVFRRQDLCEANHKTASMFKFSDDVYR